MFKPKLLWFLFMSGVLVSKFSLSSSLCKRHIRCILCVFSCQSLFCNHSKVMGSGWESCLVYPGISISF